MYKDIRGSTDRVVVAGSGRQHRRPSLEEWIPKYGEKNILEYFATSKGNEPIICGVSLNRVLKFIPN